MPRSATPRKTSSTSMRSDRMRATLHRVRPAVARSWSMPAAFLETAQRLAAVGRRFHRRGWVLGTSGNFSAVLGRDPLRLAITVSGADKGDLRAEQFVAIDAAGKIERSEHGGRPSEERALHLELATPRSAGAVLHTHSVWSTILSDLHAEQGGIAIEGYEMLKGLRGISTHRQREWLPILENDQDVAALAGRVRTTLETHPQAHGFLLRRHGLYA